MVTGSQRLKQFYNEPYLLKAWDKDDPCGKYTGRKQQAWPQRRQKMGQHGIWRR
jgi:hypothetical protein